MGDLVHSASGSVPVAPSFDDLRFVDRPARLTTGASMDFPNGYGVSVIIGPYTYGGDEGLYELAVIHEGSLCYTTPVTDYVEGHLTPDDVTRLMREVAALPAAEQSA